MSRQQLTEEAAAKFRKMGRDAAIDDVRGKERRGVASENDLRWLKRAELQLDAEKRRIEAEKRRIEAERQAEMDRECGHCCDRFVLGVFWVCCVVVFVGCGYQYTGIRDHKLDAVAAVLAMVMFLASVLGACVRLSA